VVGDLSGLFLEAGLKLVVEYPMPAADCAVFFCDFRQHGLLILKMGFFCYFFFCD
jgi:hypothetical protein